MLMSSRFLPTSAVLKATQGRSPRPEEAMRKESTLPAAVVSMLKEELS